jgi:dTDP-glucose 4,6-dehydratase
VRILITGGAGFIGSNFVKWALNNHDSLIEKVVVLDKLTYAGTLTNLTDIDTRKLEFVQNDICDSEIVESLVKRVDLITHFAAETHVDRSISGPAEFILTNVLGTQVLLDAVKKKPEIRLIHISTDEVYGSIDEGSWDESFPLQPNSPYSASKAASDLIALSYARTYGLDICVTRCCNNYGPNQFPEKLIPLFVTNIMENKKLPLYGDGSNIREWIHVEDHCRAIWQVVQDGDSGEIYNIGSGIEKSNLELTKLILDEFKLELDYIQKMPDRLNHDSRYSLNSNKLITQLGWKPTIDFEKGLRSTIKWYQENRAWWQPLKQRVD